MKADRAENRFKILKLTVFLFIFRLLGVQIFKREAFGMLVLVKTASKTVIAFSVVRRTALRANDNVVAVFKLLFGYRS